MTDATRGLFLALFAYGVWGSFALFFSLVKHIPALEVLTHRIVWCAILVSAIITVTGAWKAIGQIFKQPKILLALMLSSVMIAANWGLYIWSVSNNHTVDASFGYFINPLIAVLLGVVFLKEKLATYQKLAIALAFCGVAYKIIVVGEFPWIALTIAITFSIYGLIRKQTPVDTVSGLMIETLLVLPLAAGYFVWLSLTQTSHFALDSNGALLVFAGIITALPLLAFASAARKLSLATLGFMTYIAPSLQLLSAVVVLGEPFARDEQITFGFIWLGLLLFTGGTVWRQRKTPAAITATGEKMS